MSGPYVLRDKHPMDRRNSSPSIRGPQLNLTKSTSSPVSQRRNTIHFQDRNSSYNNQVYSNYGPVEQNRRMISQTVSNMFYGIDDDNINHMRTATPDFNTGTKRTDCSMKYGSEISNNSSGQPQRTNYTENCVGNKSYAFETGTSSTVNKDKNENSDHPIRSAATSDNSDMDKIVYIGSKASKAGSTGKQSPIWIKRKSSPDLQITNPQFARIRGLELERNSQQRDDGNFSPITRDRSYSNPVPVRPRNYSPISKRNESPIPGYSHEHEIERKCYSHEWS
ncbi:unnamed protein product, partial [Owenia fusiformis]